MSSKNRRKHAKSNQVKNWERPARFDLGLVQAVKERDGDTCRSCGCEVVWGERRGSRGSRLFHLDSQHPPRVWNIVVACNECSQSPYWRNEVVTRLIDENLDPSLVKKKDRGWLKVDGKSSEPISEPASALQESYWVLVAPKTAGWLDANGLMESWKDKNGQVVPNPLHIPGKAIHGVDGLPFFTLAGEAEPTPGPSDVTSVSGAGIAQSKRSSKPGSVPCSEETRGTPSELEQLGLVLAHAGARLWGEPDRDAGRYREPVVASLQLELDPDVLRMIQGCLDARASGREVLFIEDPDLVSAIKDIVDHVFSPLVGAPNGAGVGTSDPIGGDGGGVSGMKLETPSTHAVINFDSSLDEASLAVLLEKHLAEIRAQFFGESR